MVYKLLLSEPTFKCIFSSYTGGFIDMYVPNHKDERHVYIHIADFQLPQFLGHFRTTVTLLKNLDDYPESKLSMLSNRMNKFTHILPSLK
jgi:hypothetical protein